jgi:phosphatidylglycerol---prolipoprotein diacylglyceryl transferase
MLVIGCLLASVLLVEDARKQRYSVRDTLAVIMAGYAGGLVGAAAIPVIQGLGALVRDGRFSMSSGFAAYGGMIGGILCGVLMLKRLKLDVPRFLDTCAPVLGLGYFFARIGCLMAGCDYGIPSTGPGAIAYPPGSYCYVDQMIHGLIQPGALQSLKVHPTQLYSSFAGLLLFFVVRALPNRGDGRRFVVFVIGYAFLRSAIELLRGDGGRGTLGPLTTSQFIAVCTLAALAILWVQGVLPRRAAPTSPP